MADTKYAVESGFYDSVNHDRLYSADDMNEPYKSFLTEGIVEGCLAVSAQSTPDMTLNVAAGKALLGNKWVAAAATTVTVPENTALYSRIDSIILQVDVNTSVRAAALIYRTGTPASEPEAPALIGTTGITEVRIANITVAAGATAISGSNISDQRGGSSCPYITAQIFNAQLLVAVEAVLEAHPEWTTTVEDGSITLAKLAAGVIDNTLTQAGAAAEAKKTGDEISGLKDALGDVSELTTEDKDSVVDAINEVDAETTSLETNKANIDGYYEDLTSGQAEQVLSNVKETERSPYIFRASGGSLEIGDREQDTLVGMDLVWNQLVKNGNFEGATNWSAAGGSMSVADNKLTLTASSNQYYASGECYYEKDRVLLVIFNAFYDTNNSGSSAPLVMLNWSSGEYHQFNSITKGVRTEIGCLLKPNTDGNIAYFYGGTQAVSGDVFTIDSVRCIDLTAMFGSTIADYIYSLETGTAGAGVAWVKRYLTKDYYPYSAPTMQNGVASSHDMVGFNQWDEEWEVGLIDVNTGQNVPSNAYSRSKNYIQVLPTTYYFAPNDKTIYIRKYDANKNYIGYRQVFSYGRTLDFDDETAFIRICWDGTTYNHDICINFHYDGERDGEYEPYVKHSYPLDDTVDLHGIPKIDASGNLYADGDTYEADGTVTRKYRKHTLSSADSFNVTTGETLSQVAWSGYNSIGINSARFLCDKFVNDGSSGLGKVWSSTSAPRMYFGLPNTVTNADEAGAWFDANPTTVIYPLATPTTESAEPFQTPQIVDNWGTEEYVTSGNVPIGHTTGYPINIKAKVEVAPDAPEADGTYLMQRLNGVNSYIPFVKELPTLPSEDGNYLLGLSVAGSGTTKTLSWEVQS